MARRLRPDQEAIMASPDKHASLHKLGAPALKQALTNHLAATYPDASPALLTALLDANLSRHNLIRVAEGLESKDLIVVLKCKENGQDYIKEDGLRIGMDGYGLAVLSTTQTAPGDPPMHKIWEMALGGVGKNIIRIPTRELGIGFRAGMHNYAVQVAGLFYMDSKYDFNQFWEMYKTHMEPIIGPEDLVEKSAAAKAFEAEMKYVLEAVPRYQLLALRHL